MVSKDVGLKAGAVPNYTVEYSEQATAGMNARRAIDDIKMIFGSISVPDRMLLKDCSLRSWI